MAINFTNIPNECYACEKTCLLEFPETCNAAFGLIVAASSLTVYIIFTIALSVRLALMIYKKVRTLKILIIGCYFMFCLLRTIKFIIMLTGKLTLNFYLIDYLLYYEGFVFLFIGYYGLVIFWTAICNNRGVSGVWFSSKMRKLVIAFAIGTVVIFSSLAFIETYAYANLSWWDATVFGIIALYAFCLALGNAIQGTKVLRALHSFQIKDREVIKGVTIMITMASATLLICLVIFIIVTILGSFSFILCQMSHTVFRFLEIAIFLAISVPMGKSSRTDKSSEQRKESTNKEVSLNDNYIE